MKIKTTGPAKEDLPRFKDLAVSTLFTWRISEHASIYIKLEKNYYAELEHGYLYNAAVNENLNTEVIPQLKLYLGGEVKE